MRFNKKYKQGLFLLFLLLLITASISFITIKPKIKIFNENSVSLSATEDPYEENDDPSSATDIRSNEANWLSIISGNGTQWDDDWYVIDLDSGEERLRVELIFNHSAGNIDIEVYDWNLNYIDGSYSIDDNEYLERDIFPNGTYYLKVFGYNAGNTYDLWWEDLMPYDDWMEENDDFWSATWVDPNYYFGLKIIGGDDDWFRTYLKTGDTINVSIYFDNSQGNLQLELYDPNDSDNLRVGSYTDGNNEFILFTADYSGDWRIHIYHEFADSDVDYDLDIWRYEGDDGMEENDDYWSAHWVNAKYYPDLRIMEYDEDWFRTYLNPDDTIDVRIYFENYQGDLQLELYDPNDSNNPRVGSYSDRNDEFIFLLQIFRVIGVFAYIVFLEIIILLFIII